MEYVNDINIVEAVIHILDNNSDEPILNEYKLDLGDEIYKYIYRHIEKALKDEELKYAVFNPERNIVKELSQEYLMVRILIWFLYLKKWEDNCLQ